MINDEKKNLKKQIKLLSSLIWLKTKCVLAPKREQGKRGAKRR